ncbi:HsdM family class I SAM-dependent methyltransferase [Clostridium sporogenes]|uniref:site-specific DNA-methyltransferase (adenine-specific) n=2 Tax=Clostridiaceae TaxID=31979 RepID=A0A1J1CT25_CLOSG|nr:N-6 DNA methylase [Clostridium sporogenes]APF25130.1 eco57I restriction-modification methylase family protein [Clostridium sporogenes]APH14600.1 eco57I restriction-modification methylase family protein [Clostridium sporogenes]
MVERISNTTQMIIKKLGYHNSKNLYYFANINMCKDLSFHDKKVLNEIKPCAFFVVDGKPKVLFFDYISENDSKQKLYKKIWNAQIPIIIFNDYDSIKVFNGNSMELSELDNIRLQFVLEEEHKKCSEASPFSYWNITNEQFLREYQMAFSKDTLNQVMIKNIKCITEKLKKQYKVKFATKLILRLIFIRFLIDRGIDIGYEGFNGDIKESQEALLKLANNKKGLYSFFSYLKNKFNGNLFELGNEVYDEALNDEVFELLKCFLSGKQEMESGQLSFLPLYDFNIIPIELISNIYEVLLGEKAQDDDKAFYTPEYLADYIVKESLGTFLTKDSQCKVLDPSCGSGIFLVESLQLIISKNVDDNGYIKDNDKLCQLIESNIYGVDSNPEAIDVTIFSLYLTLFDYKDPKSLDDFRLPNLKNKNLWVSDFFDDEKLIALKKIKFQFILGNPPWGSIKEGLHLQYCDKNKIPQYRQEISRSFIAKVKEYSNEDTICCLIVPSKLFYNQKKPAIEFRKLLLLKCEILQIVELSSVRSLIFKKADAPAAILMFKNSTENCLSHKMLHLSLKPNMFFKIYHVIAIEKTDIKNIQQDILYRYDWVWKTCVYGNSWDIDIITMLKRKFPKIEDVINKNKLKTGAGITDTNGKYDAKDYIGKNMIESTAIDTLYFNSSNSSIFNKRKIYRLGKKEIFSPPYCLLRKGPNCKNYRLRAAYTEEDVIFKEAISAIKGDKSQKDLLLNITGMFNSSLYAYLNLMLGSSMGIEREQVFMKEVYEYPFAYDEGISSKVEAIQKKNSNLKNGFYQDISQDISQLDQMILDKFGLKEDPFIDYAINVQIPLLNSKKMTFREVTAEELKDYSKVFMDYWKKLMAEQNKFIKISLYPKVVGKFAIFELEICDQKEKEITIIDTIDSNKEILSRFLINKINEQFYKLKDVLYFKNNSFFIIKSNEYKNWHPAMSHIDQSMVLETIISDDSEE